MKFMLCMVTDEKTGIRWSPERDAALMAEHMKFRDELVARGKLVSSGRLRPESYGARVRVEASGRVSIVDGPFAETKEVIGGYYVIDCASMEEARDWAARCPSASLGPIEVRPLYPEPDEGSS